MQVISNSFEHIALNKEETKFIEVPYCFLAGKDNICFMTVKPLPYTAFFIKLLKGPIEYLEKSSWEKLIQYKTELVSFLQQLGLILVLDEQDGYAYIKHLVAEEDETINISWIQRRALTYDESVLLVLLREMMAEFEQGEVTKPRVNKKRREIKEYAELFFRENASRVKFLKDIDRFNRQIN